MEILDFIFLSNKYWRTYAKVGRLLCTCCCHSNTKPQPRVHICCHDNRLKTYLLPWWRKGLQNSRGTGWSSPPSPCQSWGEKWKRKGRKMENNLQIKFRRRWPLTQQWLLITSQIISLHYESNREYFVSTKISCPMVLRVNFKSFILNLHYSYPS